MIDLTWGLREGRRAKIIMEHGELIIEMGDIEKLTTQERLQRIGASESTLCKLCSTDPGTTEHELISCSYNSNCGNLLVNCLQAYLPNLSPHKLLHLELHGLDPATELPATILVAVTLSSIWKQRSSNTRVCIYTVRSELELAVSLLRTTRLVNAAETLDTLQQLMFH